VDSGVTEGTAEKSANRDSSEGRNTGETKKNWGGKRKVPSRGIQGRVCAAVLQGKPFTEKGSAIVKEEETTPTLKGTTKKARRARALSRDRTRRAVGKDEQRTKRSSLLKGKKRGAKLREHPPPAWPAASRKAARKVRRQMPGSKAQERRGGVNHCDPLEQTSRHAEMRAFARGDLPPSCVEKRRGRKRISMGREAKKRKKKK